MCEKIKYLISSMTALLIFQICVFSQDANGNWVRLESDDGEFSIELPNNEASAYFYDKEGFYYNNFPTGPFNFKEMQMLHGALDKTYMSVEIYRMSNPKVYLDEIAMRKNLAFSNGFLERKNKNCQKVLPQLHR